MNRPLPVVADRPCRPCTVCCTLMRVDELDKPDATPCSHLVGGGCGIYRGRPQSCRNFKCFWKLGMLPERGLRPDECGVMFWSNAAGNMVVGREVWKHARAGETVRKIIRTYVDAGICVYVITFDNQRVIYGEPPLPEEGDEEEY